MKYQALLRRTNFRCPAWGNRRQSRYLPYSPKPKRVRSKANHEMPQRRSGRMHRNGPWEAVGLLQHRIPIRHPPERKRLMAKKHLAKHSKLPAVATQTFWHRTKRRFSMQIFAGLSRYLWAV